MLPPRVHQIIAAIADHCGEEVAVLLVNSFPGQRLYIPRIIRMTADHEIARAIGLDAAARLAEHFGGDWVAVPKALGPEAHAGARAAILQWARRGLKVRDIAARAGVTEVRVYQVLADERRRTGRNPRSNPRQREMFG